MTIHNLSPSCITFTLLLYLGLHLLVLCCLIFLLHVILYFNVVKDFFVCHVHGSIIFKHQND